MKFGCCVNMNATGPDKIGMEQIDTLAKAGYDYVELPLAEMTALSDADVRGLKKKLMKSGLSCGGCNNFFPKNIRLTGPNIANDQMMAYVNKALALAADVGAQYVVFGSGGAKNVPEGFELQEGYKQVVHLLKQVAPIARERGITIVIEPLCKAECNIINTFKEGCQLARDVDDPNIRVLVDFYHLTVENESVQALLNEGAQYLRHVHFANPTDRVFPLDETEANYQPFFDALRAVGYDARISCEAYTQNFAADAVKTLEFFKRNT